MNQTRHLPYMPLTPAPIRGRRKCQREPCPDSVLLLADYNNPERLHRVDRVLSQCVNHVEEVVDYRENVTQDSFARKAALKQRCPEYSTDYTVVESKIGRREGGFSGP